MFVSSAIPTSALVAVVVQTPSSQAYTGVPFSIMPVHLTGTRPFRAIAWPSISEFIKYAGFSLITPIAKSLDLAGLVSALTSASPSNLCAETVITVPTGCSISVVYFSAKSAYCACVAVPLKNTAVKFPEASLAAIVFGVAAVEAGRPVPPTSTLVALVAVPTKDVACISANLSSALPILYTDVVSGYIPAMVLTAGAFLLP